MDIVTELKSFGLTNTWVYYREYDHPNNCSTRNRLRASVCNMNIIIPILFLGAIFTSSCATTPQPETAGRYEKEVYAWLCAAQSDGGYIAPEGRDFESVYANSVAAMAFTLKGDTERAERFFDFLHKLMPKEFVGPSVRHRGFVQFHKTDGTPLMDSIRWEGDNSWVLLALTYYKEKTGNTKYDDMARAIADWLADLQDRPGAEISEENDYGLWYGFDGYGSNFVHSKNTEGCVDAWAALAAYPDKAEVRENLRKYLLSKCDAEQKYLTLVVGNWRGDNSELDAWACMSGFAPDLLSMDHVTNFLVHVVSETSGQEMDGFAFMLDDVRDGRLEVAPTLEIAAAYGVLGDAKSRDRWLAEIEKTILDSELYPGTKGFSFIANKTRWPNDPADLRRISPHASAWYVLACEGFNPFKPSAPRDSVLRSVTATR